MKLSKPMFSITKPIILGLVICLLTFAHTKQVSAETESSHEYKVTDEMKLLYYYIFLKEGKFLDILTEAEVAIIIDELKQFPPEVMAKFLHHDAKMFQAIEKNISVTQRRPKSDSKRYHVNYEYNDKKYKISFSPTIEQAWLRGRTEEWDTNLLDEFPDDGGPLFVNLTYANNNNIIPLIQFFLDNGVDINTRNPNNHETIFSSVGTLEIAQFLLANGADHTVVTNRGATPLIYAISGESSNELIKFLIDIGVDLHANPSIFGTALDTAKNRIKYLARDSYDMEDNDDPEYLEAVHARFEKAEEVVNIIEQALEADKKSAK